MFHHFRCGSLQDLDKPYQRIGKAGRKSAIPKVLQCRLTVIMYNVTASGALGVLFLHSFVALVHWLEAALLLCCASALVCAVFGRAYVVTSCFSEFRHQLSSKFDLGEPLADFDGFTR